MLACLHVKRNRLEQIEHLLKHYPSIRLMGDPLLYEGTKGQDGKATIYFEGDIAELEGFESDVITNGFKHRE
jgi:hypothetical protein